MNSSHVVPLSNRHLVVTDPAVGEEFARTAVVETAGDVLAALA